MAKFCLNSEDFGVPHHRVRVYIVGRLRHLVKGLMKIRVPGGEDIEAFLDPLSVKQPPETKQFTAIERRNLTSVIKALRNKGAEPRDENFLVDVDASETIRGVRKNACPCMLASRTKGFWITSRDRRLTLSEASRLQGMEPLTSRTLSSSKLFSLLGNAMTRTVYGGVLRTTLVSIGVTEFPHEKPPVTVLDRKVRPFTVPVGSRLVKVKGPRPYTYLEEGGVAHMQTFGGDQALQETVSVTDAVSKSEILEPCETCEPDADGEVVHVRRARLEDHVFGILGKCRKCDWHLCNDCSNKGVRCTCLDHFQKPELSLMTRDYHDGFASAFASSDHDHLASAFAAIPGSGEASAPPLVALYLPPHALQEYVESRLTSGGRLFRKSLKCRCE